MLPIFECWVSLFFNGTIQKKRRPSLFYGWDWFINSPRAKILDSTAKSAVQYILVHCFVQIMNTDFSMHALNGAAWLALKRTGNNCLFKNKTSAFKWAVQFLNLVRLKGHSHEQSLWEYRFKL
jgi:hypothetical protein